jgi:hypothetical protein
VRLDREIIPTRLKKLVKSNQEQSISSHGVLRAHTLYVNSISSARKNLDVVEVGVFRGGTAKIILEGIQNVPESKSRAYLIDTFSGHPENAVNSKLDGAQRVRQFSDTSYGEVRNFLQEYTPRFELIQENALNLRKDSLPTLKKIGMCHIDMDLYLPTLHVLNVFSKRMVIGSIFVIDDYNNARSPGTNLAVSEFLHKNHSYIQFESSVQQSILIRIN